MEESRVEFSRFMSLVGNVTSDDYEVVRLLQRRFNKCLESYIEGSDFKDLVLTTTERIRQDTCNKYVYIKQFADALRSYGGSSKSRRTEEKDENVKPRSSKGRKRSYDTDQGDTDGAPDVKKTKQSNPQTHSAFGGHAASSSTSGYLSDADNDVIVAETRQTNKESTPGGSVSSDIVCSASVDADISVVRIPASQCQNTAPKLPIVQVLSTCGSDPQLPVQMPQGGQGEVSSRRDGIVIENVQSVASDDVTVLEHLQSNSSSNAPRSDMKQCELSARRAVCDLKVNEEPQEMDGRAVTSRPECGQKSVDCTSNSPTTLVCDESESDCSDSKSMKTGTSEARSAHTEEDVALLGSEEDTPGSEIEVKKTRKGESKQVEKLEKLLEHLRDKIEELEHGEVSLNDLDNEDTSYLKIDRYKRRFVQVWNKLCEVKGRTTTTGRPTERRFVYDGTRWCEINRKIEKLINKFKTFPDFQDVRDIVKSCNKKYYHGYFTKSKIDSLSKSIFTEVGNLLQERRHEDFVSNFGCRIIDTQTFGPDPAMYDRRLRQKLEENRNIGRSRLEEVINKYADKQDYTDDESEEEEEEDDVSECGASLPENDDVPTENDYMQTETDEAQTEHGGSVEGADEDLSEDDFEEQPSVEIDRDDDLDPGLTFMPVYDTLDNEPSILIESSAGFETQEDLERIIKVESLDGGFAVDAECLDFGITLKSDDGAVMCAQDLMSDITNSAKREPCKNAAKTESQVASVSEEATCGALTSISEQSNGDARHVTATVSDDVIPLSDLSTVLYPGNVNLTSDTESTSMEPKTHVLTDRRGREEMMPARRVPLTALSKSTSETKWPHWEQRGSKMASEEKKDVAAACENECHGANKTDAMQRTSQGASPNASQSATPDVTPNTSQGATPNTSQSASPDASRTATPNASRSATPNASRSATPNASRSATANASQSATPNASQSATANASQSVTPVAVINLDPDGGRKQKGMASNKSLKGCIEKFELNLEKEMCLSPDCIEVSEVVQSWTSDSNRTRSNRDSNQESSYSDAQPNDQRSKDLNSVSSDTIVSCSLKVSSTKNKTNRSLQRPVGVDNVIGDAVHPKPISVDKRNVCSDSPTSSLLVKDPPGLNQLYSMIHSSVKKAMPGLSTSVEIVDSSSDESDDATGGGKPTPEVNNSRTQAEEILHSQDSAESQIAKSQVGDKVRESEATDGSTESGDSRVAAANATEKASADEATTSTEQRPCESSANVDTVVTVTKSVPLKSKTSNAEVDTRVNEDRKKRAAAGKDTTKDIESVCKRNSGPCSQGTRNDGVETIVLDDSDISSDSFEGDLERSSPTKRQSVANAEAISPKRLKMDERTREIVSEALSKIKDLNNCGDVTSAQGSPAVAKYSSKSGDTKNDKSSSRKSAESEETEASEKCQEVTSSQHRGDRHELLVDRLQRRGDTSPERSAEDIGTAAPSIAVTTATSDETKAKEAPGSTTAEINSRTLALKNSPRQKSPDTDCDSDQKSCKSNSDLERVGADPVLPDSDTPDRPEPNLQREASPADSEAGLSAKPNGMGLVIESVVGNYSPVSDTPRSELKRSGAGGEMSPKQQGKAAETAQNSTGSSSKVKKSPSVEFLSVEVDLTLPSASKKTKESSSRRSVKKPEQSPSGSSAAPAHKNATAPRLHSVKKQDSDIVQKLANVSGKSGQAVLVNGAVTFNNIIRGVCDKIQSQQKEQEKAYLRELKVKGLQITSVEMVGKGASLRTRQSTAGVRGTAGSCPAGKSSPSLGSVRPAAERIGRAAPTNSSQRANASSTSVKSTSQSVSPVSERTTRFLGTVTPVGPRVRNVQLSTDKRSRPTTSPNLTNAVISNVARNIAQNLGKVNNSAVKNSSKNNIFSNPPEVSRSRGFGEAFMVAPLQTSTPIKQCASAPAKWREDSHKPSAGSSVKNTFRRAVLSPVGDRHSSEQMVIQRQHVPQRSDRHSSGKMPSRGQHVSQGSARHGSEKMTSRGQHVSQGWARHSGEKMTSRGQHVSQRSARHGSEKMTSRGQYVSQGSARHGNEKMTSRGQHVSQGSARHSSEKMTTSQQHTQQRKSQRRPGSPGGKTGASRSQQLSQGASRPGGNNGRTRAKNRELWTNSDNPIVLDD